MININEKKMYEDLNKKIKTIQSNKSVKEILVKDILINNIQDISKGLKKCIHDKYSDIDITIFVKDNFMLKLNDIGILKEDILGIKLEKATTNCVVRVVQKNGIRYDIILFGINSLELENEINLLEKSETFVAILALGKLMREDYLISAHLAHMLCMNSLVEQMENRDLEYNTNFHRYGYKENLNYYDTYKSIKNKYCNLDNEVHNHIAKLLISGIENIENISKEEKKIFYEIWDFYLK